MPTNSLSDEELESTMDVVSTARNDRCHTGFVKAQVGFMVFSTGRNLPAPSRQPFRGPVPW